jgi:hypothetical protein
MALEARVDAVKNPPRVHEVLLCQQEVPQAADLLLLKPRPQQHAALTLAEESAAAFDGGVHQASLQVDLKPA